MEINCFAFLHIRTYLGVDKADIVAAGSLADSAGSKDDTLFIYMNIYGYIWIYEVRVSKNLYRETVRLFKR